MPDYSNCIIYKLCCRDLSVTDIYIGSTRNFRHRKCVHKHDYNKGKETKAYQFIRANGGWENWDMVQMAKVSVADMYELRAVEREYYEKYKPTLNGCRPIVTQEEHDEQCRENNKKQREKYKAMTTDCGCGGRFSPSNKKRHEKSQRHQKWISQSTNQSN